MKKSILLALVLFVLVGCSTTSGTTNQRTIVDFNNNDIVLNNDIERAMVSNRYLLDIIRGIGAIDQVVAIDSQAFSTVDFWPEFTEADVYGKGITDLDYEKIAAYNPDVFITIPEFYDDAFADKMKQIDIPVVVVSVAMAQDDVTLQQISILGDVFNKQEGAQKVKEFYTTVRNTIQDRLTSLTERPSVYIEFKNPYATGLPGTTWSRMIDAAGGVNALGEDDGVKGQWEAEPEAVITSNPDLIVKTVFRNDGKDSYHAPELTDFDATLQELKQRDSFNKMNSVENEHVVLASDFVFRGAFNTVGMAYMAKWIHPELFEDFDADAIFDQWMTEFQNLSPVDGHVMDLRHGND